MFKLILALLVFQFLINVVTIHFLSHPSDVTLRMHLEILFTLQSTHFQSLFSVRSVQQFALLLHDSFPSCVSNKKHLEFLLFRATIKSFWKIYKHCILCTSRQFILMSLGVIGGRRLYN